MALFGFFLPLFSDFYLIQNGEFMVVFVPNKDVEFNFQ
jgi:hypothetical protein